MKIHNNLNVNEINYHITIHVPKLEWHLIFTFLFMLMSSPNESR